MKAILPAAVVMLAVMACATNGETSPAPPLAPYVYSMPKGLDVRCRMCDHIYMARQMIQATVKARKVGDSIVMTLPRSVLEATGLSAGDSLLLQAGESRFLSVRKENDKVAKLEETTMELDVLQRKLGVLEAETELATVEHNNSMPTLHPGIEDPTMMEAYMKDMYFKRSKVQLEIAEKKLEIYRMGGGNTHE